MHTDLFYIKTKGRAGELETKIKRTDASIGEIVYELHWLANGEIEIREPAVGE